LSVKKVFVKQLGVELPRLGFGIMRMPTSMDGKIDYDRSVEMLDRAYNEGVNYFDTAHFYHNYESQPFLGKALTRYPRESFYLATKLPIWECATKADVERIVNRQFAECQVDYFDFYLVHSLNAGNYERMVNLGVYEYLTGLKKAGKIKFLGFSYHGDYPAFKKTVENYKWDFAQLQINYVDTHLISAGALYDLLCEHNIPCITMEPVRGGFLAEPPQPVRDLMNNFPGKKLSPAAWAFRWCIDKDNMPLILSGMSNMEQVEENLRTFSDEPEKLTAEEATMLDRARDIMLGIKTVPCTSCDYCMDCPLGVDIPGVFRIYNHYKLFPDKFVAGNSYGARIRAGKDYTACTSCGVCSPLCPQGINIPEALAAADKELRPLLHNENDIQEDNP
jgi:hypothetical protein